MMDDKNFDENSFALKSTETKESDVVPVGDSIRGSNLVDEATVMDVVESRSVQLLCCVNGFECTAVLDTSSSLSLIKWNSYNKLNDESDLMLISPALKALVLGCDEVELDIYTNIQIKLGSANLDQRVFLVDNLKTDMLLGSDFMMSHCKSIDWETMKLDLTKDDQSVQLYWK